MRISPTTKCAMVRKHFLRAPAGQIITTRDLLQYGSRSAVDQAISMWIKERFIERLAPGMYCRRKSGEQIPIVVIAQARANAFGKQLHSVGIETATEARFVACGATTSFMCRGKRIVLEGAGFCVHMQLRQHEAQTASPEPLPHYMTCPIHSDR